MGKLQTFHWTVSIGKPYELKRKNKQKNNNHNQINEAYIIRTFPLTCPYQFLVSECGTHY